MIRVLVTGVVLASALLIASCDQHSVHYHNSDLIVGGRSFEPEDSLPHHVVLLKINSISSHGNISQDSYCSGVLIFNQYVLTAAHCVRKEDLTQLEVIFPLSKGREIIKPGQTLIHPEYTPDNLDRQYTRLRDIALIRLSQPLPKPYTSLNLIQFNLKQSLDFRAAGFGQQNGMILKKPDNTLELKYAVLKTDNYDVNSPYFDALQKKSGVCFGDSGGPAVVSVNDEDYLIGIAVDVLFNPSRVFEPRYDRCLEKSVYLNVPYFREWIVKAVESLQ